MGSAIEIAQRAVIGGDRRSFFERTRQKLRERQSLQHRRIDIARADPEGIFSRAQPIEHLFVGADNGNIGFGMQLSDEFRTEIRLSIKKYLRRAYRSRDQRIHRDDFSLPLRAEQVPIRFDLSRIYQLGVKSNFAAPRRAFEHEDVTIFRIVVMMSALVPSRKIDDIR